ncbi:MAG: c-type cytochrome [Gemmatimonadota bacterium]
MVKKILLTLFALIGVVIVTLAASISLRWDRTFEAPYPELNASSDPQVIARGRYLAFGPAHCSDCHTADADRDLLRAGGTPPLSGGLTFVIPPGTIRVPNITPDSATGIGRRSDGEIARMLRYGVRHDGRAAIPFMEFYDMSDSDIVALLSFVRSQPPVAHAVADHELSWVGKGATAFLISPIGPSAPPPAANPATGPTVARGAYIVNALANCAGCHTQRNMVSGAYTGPTLHGGMEMESSVNAKIRLVPPDITSGPGGRIATWTEDEFVARFRAGERIPGSPMPWQAFGRMSDDDLRAIYRYLRSVPIS